MSITERELTLLRTEQQKFMDRKVTVRRAYTVVQDDPTDANFATGVPCSIKEGWGYYRVIADRYQVSNPHILTFAWNADIKVGDTLILEDGPEAVFAVRELLDADSYPTALRVMADRSQ